jgi:FtsP/CotA-like multicopper oxidase with cupredoxin domain
MKRIIRQFGLLLCSTLLAAAAMPRAPESIVTNDNRRAGGTLKNGVLTLKLEARTGEWRPEGDKGRAVTVGAWAEAGKPLSVPGPLVRVPVGTDVRASLKNTLDRPLTVFGFGKTRAMADSVVIPVGQSRDVQFKATTPGTYYYTARGPLTPLGIRAEPDMELVGAIVVDPPGAPAQPNDRVLLLSWWFTVDMKSPTGLGRGTMAINGLSWPHTERIDLTQNDSVHWRVINTTEIDHPMHLHGFYFRVERKGDGVQDTLYTKDQQRLAVTEIVGPGQTESISFLPDRPGNWIFHCHFADHISSIVALDREQDHFDESMSGQHPSDRPHQMFGLVLGLRVAPKGPPVKLAEAPRQVRMIMRQKDNVYGKNPGYSMVLGGTADEKNPNAMPVPGPTLVLERGKPVAITVVNHAKDHGSIHWHGVELESYPDGVPGWSGSGNQTLPSIAPGESLTVRWTPPRAGTFMYHSHFNEVGQISSGLYGPIIVVEPGQKYDLDKDRVLFFGTSGPSTNVVIGPFSHHQMNGVEQPKPIDLKAGTTYRFRLIDLADGGPVFVTLKNGKEPVSWRAVAKDGAALPASQATARPAVLMFDPGEIYDFELTPKAGDLALTFGPPPPPPNAPPPPPNFPPPPPTRTVAVRVR